MSEAITLEILQAQIRQGERTRILWEMLMSELGCTYDDTDKTVFTKLIQVQNAYVNATAQAGAMMGMHHTTKKRKAKGATIADLRKAEMGLTERGDDGGVSSSN